MATKSKNAASAVKNERDPKAQKQEQITRVKNLLNRLIFIVDEYETETRVSYDKERQIRNINNCANTILYNETKSVFSIPTELSIVRELIFNIQNVDGILESFNRNIERLTKKGDYDEIPKQLKEATEFSESLNKHIVELNTIIAQKMEEGFGSRRDLARYKIEKEKAAKEELRKFKEEIGELYANGELFSKLEGRLKDKNISDEAIVQLKNKYVNAFLELNKEKIFKAMSSKKDYEVVAEEFEVNIKTLSAFLKNVEKDEKIEKLIEVLEKKLYETMVNDLIEEKTTTKELNKKYPAYLVKQAISSVKTMAKTKSETEVKEEKVSEKKA